MKTLRSSHSGKTRNYCWSNLLVTAPLFCSISLLISAYAENAPTFHLNSDPNNDNQVTSGNMEYVGGNTRIGVGMDTDFQGQAEISHIFQEDERGTTSGEAWLGYKIKNDPDQGFKGGGVKVNRLWAGENQQGEIDRVHKVFGAYDQNDDDDSKATVGYGQETKNSFWSGHLSKGLSNKRKTSTTIQGGSTFKKAYDYGIGGEIGTFVTDKNIRVRGGLDYEWGDEYAFDEDRPSQASLSAGIEKFFQDSPHSIAADVSANRTEGGFGRSHNSDVTGKVTYRYDFGGAGVFRSDKQTRRIRIEVPGTPTPPRYERKLVKKQGFKMVKHRAEVESDSLFALNSSRINPKATHQLHAIAKRLKSSGYQGNIRVSGHTCALGTEHHNNILSQNRANAVQNFLASQGVDSNHMIVRGFGENQPKYQNTPLEGHKNRRVAVEYVTQQQTKQAVGENVYQQVLVEESRPGKTNVVWETEEIPTIPNWVSRAIHNPIHHQRTVNTYSTTTILVADDRVVHDFSGSAIDVLVNDSPGLTLVSVTQPQNGTATIVNDQVIYQPNSSFDGVDNFTYTATNTVGAIFTATVIVTVPGNQIPQLQGDVVTTEVNQAVLINVLLNDTDPQNDPLSITSTTPPTNGVVNIVGQQVQYIPSTDFTGHDSFTYTITDTDGNVATATVTITVNSANITGGDPTTNEAPTVIDDVVSTGTGETIIIDVTANDTDPDGDELSITNLTTPTNGSITETNGQIEYTPDDGFSGTDTFTYTMTDSNGHNETATVTVSVNDAPDNGTQNEEPNIQDDTSVTDKNVPVIIDVLGNDSDPDGDTLTITNLTYPDNGTVSVVDGKILYTPNTGYCDLDTFTYTATDTQGHEVSATVAVTVNDTNADPTPQNDTATTLADTPVIINVLENDSDPDGNTVSIVSMSSPANGDVSKVGGHIKYTPSAGFSGIDSFTYTVIDDNVNGNNNTVTATVTVTVTLTNEAPTAHDDVAETLNGEPVTIDALSNDTDPEGDALSVISITPPTNGTVSDNGLFTYTPNAGYVGADSFTYTMTDGNGNQSTATVNIECK